MGFLEKSEQLLPEVVLSDAEVSAHLGLPLSLKRVTAALDSSLHDFREVAIQVARHLAE